MAPGDRDVVRGCFSVCFVGLYDVVYLCVLGFLVCFFLTRLRLTKSRSFGPKKNPFFPVFCIDRGFWVW
jgi:hypothetical protein